MPAILNCEYRNNFGNAVCAGGVGVEPDYVGRLNANTNTGNSNAECARGVGVEPDYVGG